MGNSLKRLSWYFLMIIGIVFYAAKDDASNDFWTQTLFTMPLSLAVFILAYKLWPGRENKEN